MRYHVPHNSATGVVAFILIVLCPAAITSCSSSNTTHNIQTTNVSESNFITKPDYAWLDSVSFEMYRCKRFFADGSELAFYLVGEVHAYNQPTSRFADSLLARLQPGQFLSEGSDPSLGRSEFMQRFSTNMRSLESDIGRAEPELYRLALAREIPVVFLEVIDSSTGTYAGVTKSEKAGLELLVSALEQSKQSNGNLMTRMMKFMLDNPEKSQQMMMTMLQANGIDTLALAQMMFPRSGIVDVRNEIMADKAIQYIVPGAGCVLIRFGKGHSKGMIEQLKDHDCDCEEQSLQEFLDSGT